MKRLIFLLFSLVFTSCVTSRVNQFASFAEAGKLYVTAVDGLLQETGRVAIDTDSEILLKDRDLFNQEERGDLYLERAEVLREYLAPFRICNAIPPCSVIISRRWDSLPAQRLLRRLVTG